MDVDAVIRRAPELALVDELAHTNLPEARNRKRYEDIDEILDAGIGVTSTVNIQHLESLNDEVFELTGVRVRETFPDRILDEADEVVLVDLTPEALQERLRQRQGLPGGARRRGAPRTSSGSTTWPRCASSSCASSPRTSRRDGRRRVLDPLSQQAVAERILVLVTPEPRSQRILRRAFRSGAAARLGDRRALGAPAGPAAERGTRRCRSRRSAASRASSARTSSSSRATACPRRGQAVRRRARLDLRLPRDARRVAADRDPPGLARLEARPRAARDRHPRRRRPGAARGAGAVTARARRRRRRARGRRGVLAFRLWSLRSPRIHRRRADRILVPFTGGALDPRRARAPGSGSRAPRRRRSSPPT